MTAPSSVRLLLDTDIGSDIDDAVALMYLLAQQRCDLLGITTVSGEPRRRASLAASICDAVGRGDIPIHAGAPEPLALPQRQPYATQYSAIKDRSHRTSFPQEHAVEFLRRTIRAHPGDVVLLAIGPLTNIALLFGLDPEIPSLLKGLVLMGGAFREDILDKQGARKAEWNLYLDPHAAAAVFHHGRPTCFGLDVTLQCRWPAAKCREWFTGGGEVGRLVGEMAEVWFGHRDELTFHDPLAAAGIFEPSLCTYTTGTITVATEGPATPGLTGFDATEDGPHRIATSVNAETFFEHLSQNVPG